MFTVAPAITYDTNLTTLFLVHRHIGLRTNELGQPEGLIRLRTLTGAVNSPVLSTNEVLAGHQPWAFRPAVDNFAPQTNSTVKIMNNDARIQHVVYRNGSLWVAHTIFLPSVNPTRSAVQWWQLATNGLVRQVGRIDDEAGVNFYAFPSIAVNQFNDVLLGFSSFSTNQYASGNYAFRAYHDPLGDFRLPALLKAGEGAYYKGGSRNRWGDYSATQPDPLNDASLWTIQEYALPYVGTLTNGSGRWATWWGQIAVTNPPNDNFVNSFALSGAQGNTNGTVLRATRESGEPNHLSASVGSVWYHWTAPGNGPVTFDTLGTSSGLNTLLAVYTGTSVGSLTSVATNDNANGTFQSQVTFTASSGTAYRVAIDAPQRVSDNASAFNLAWIQPQAPLITSQPWSTNVIAGNPVTFSVSAIGVPTPAYQWRKNGGNISGATSSGYTISNVEASHAGSYTVIVTNSAGSVTSAAAALGVYDSATATLGAVSVTGSGIEFDVTGVPSYTYVIQASTNLTSWVPVYTNTSPFTFSYTITTNYPARCFRAAY
ncbi:MAG: immunoglobulin domain-containing protein [Verrucomicrobia bacterium]|nr:immunoglobulin domain-containing protein [Verrucomicrobiota bacterium]